MRLIDADALPFCPVNILHDGGIYKAVVVLSEDIGKAPTIEAEPVRHGRWGRSTIVGYDGYHAIYAQPCNECGYECKIYSANFCPNCGAKMDGGANR